MTLRRLLTACLMTWIVSAVFFGSDSGISVPGLFVIGGGAAAPLLIWVVALGLALKRKQREQRTWFAPVAILLVLAAVFSGTLFRLRFLASLPALERYAAQTLARGRSHQKAARIGLFVARETEVLPNGVVRIITTSCMFDECGVVFSRNEPAVVGEDFYESLAGDWWQWTRSW